MFLFFVRYHKNEEYLNADRSTLNLVLSVRLSVNYLQYCRISADLWSCGLLRW